MPGCNHAALRCTVRYPLVLNAIHLEATTGGRHNVRHRISATATAVEDIQGKPGILERHRDPGIAIPSFSGELSTR